MLGRQHLSLTLVALACSGTAIADASHTNRAGSKCPLTFVEGVQAQQLDSALRSSGVVIATLPDQKGEVAFANSVTCGPLDQSATCEVSYKSGSQTVEKAFRLTQLFAQSGASQGEGDGHATYTVRNVHCVTQTTAADSAKDLTCWFEPYTTRESDAEFL